MGTCNSHVISTAIIPHLHEMEVALFLGLPTAQFLIPYSMHKQRRWIWSLYHLSEVMSTFVDKVGERGLNKLKPFLVLLSKCWSFKC